MLAAAGDDFNWAGSVFRLDFVVDGGIAIGRWFVAVNPIDAPKFWLVWCNWLEFGSFETRVEDEVTTGIAATDFYTLLIEVAEVYNVLGATVKSPDSRTIKAECY